MTNTASDFLIQRLHQWGVRRVFGYPGDGIDGVMEHSGGQDQISFVQVRHKRWLRLWHGPTPSSPGKSGCAWPLPAKEMVQSYLPHGHS